MEGVEEKEESGKDIPKKQDESPETYHNETESCDLPDRDQLS